MGFIHEKIDGFSLETRIESAVVHLGNAGAWADVDFHSAPDGPYYHLELTYSGWRRLREFLSDPRVVGWLNAASSAGREAKRG